MEKQVKSFEDLECWKQARQMRIAVAELSKVFPRSEQYALHDNLRRAARSVTNNIAEGYGRFHYQENAQFCRIARGSLYEVLDHLIIALDEGYIQESNYEQLKNQIKITTTLLNGYINYLLKAKSAYKKN